LTIVYTPDTSSKNRMERPNVAIVDNDLLETLIWKVEKLSERVEQMHKEMHEVSIKYMTTAQVCEYIKKSENWVLLHKHDLGCSKRAGTLLFKRTAIDQYLGEDWFKEGEEIILTKRPAKRRAK
jgi:hypothetical protein